MPVFLNPLEEAARERLRQGPNPFHVFVATAANDDECLRYHVPELLASQLADIKGIIDLYRAPGHRASQVVPIVGDPGSGKTHLLNILKHDLANSRQLFVVVETYSGQKDPINFFLWQIVNHLLGRGPGTQLLAEVSGRLTARLVGEAVRRLEPSQRLDLIPARGLWQRLGRRFGWKGVVQPVLKRVDGLLQSCSDGQAGSLPDACRQCGIDLPRLLEAVHRHLESTEGQDTEGYLRSRLYESLARFSLLGDRESLEDFLTNGLTEVPEHILGTGQVTRKLLAVLLEVFRVLHVPVVLAFDQLEDFLRAGSPEVQREQIHNFGLALVSLINCVPGLSVLLFVERDLWTHIIQGLDLYIRDRLRRPLGLPGQPEKPYIELPDHFHPEELAKVVRARVMPRLGDLESKEQLPAAFPFSEADLERVAEETSLRTCLQKLGQRFGELVGPGPIIDLEEFTKKLTQLWFDQLRRAADTLAGQGVSGSMIPLAADALGQWLQFVNASGLSGSPPWAKTEVREHGTSICGYLNLIRVDGPRSAGTGIGLWLANGRHRPGDLEAKLSFFQIKPAIIRKLIILRPDATDALKGRSREVYERALHDRRDVQVDDLATEELAAIFAYPEWLNAIVPELQANEFHPDPEKNRELQEGIIKAIVVEQTGSFLARVRQWCQSPAEVAL
jgi:hypothetical protein